MGRSFQRLYPIPCKRLLPLALLFALLPASAPAGPGPTVSQLEQYLETTWEALEIATGCRLPPPQDSLCMRAYAGQTLEVRALNRNWKALIVLETEKVDTLSGPLLLQRSGFLIGPYEGYAYRLVIEKQSQPAGSKRVIRDLGLKLTAHPVNGQQVEGEGLALNRGLKWLDGLREPWTYHWTAVARLPAILEAIQRKLNRRR